MDNLAVEGQHRVRTPMRCTVPCIEPEFALDIEAGKGRHMEDLTVAVRSEDGEPWIVPPGLGRCGRFRDAL